MMNPWSDRALGWGLSLVLHATAFGGATTIALSPCSWWGMDPDFVVYQSRPPDLVFLLNRVESPRELFDRSGRHAEAPALPFDTDSGREDDLGSGAGFTQRGLSAKGRDRYCSPSE
ncbi:MAG: hypothetical protein HY293_05730, partial [Planctomycetes bacterium]|nr:hypothetical protein [Planctomycetota bacterium]